MLHEIKKISLLKNTDWGRIQKIFNFIWKQMDLDKFKEHRRYEPVYRSDIISLGKSYGGITETTKFTNGTPWRTWTGNLLEHCIPWKKTFEEKIHKSGLVFVNFSYTRHSTIISSHIDSKTENEGNNGHCNLNFILNCEDQNAYMWASDGLNKIEQRSIPMTAWLLQTDTYHGVKNNGLRDVFQIKFHSPYKKVAKFIDDNPDFLDYELQY